MVLAGAGVGGVGVGAAVEGGDVDGAVGVSGASGDSCESGRRGLGPAVQMGRRGGGGAWAAGGIARGSELAAMVGVIDPQLGLLALSATGAASVGEPLGVAILAGIAVVAAAGGTLTAG